MLGRLDSAVVLLRARILECGFPVCIRPRRQRLFSYVICGARAMPMIWITEVLAVLCSTSVTASQEQLYDVNGFGPGFAVMFCARVQGRGLVLLKP